MYFDLPTYSEFDICWISMTLRNAKGSCYEEFSWTGPPNEFSCNSEKTCDSTANIPFLTGFIQATGLALDPGSPK
jgi:hypothetical protein